MAARSLLALAAGATNECQYLAADFLFVAGGTSPELQIHAICVPK